MDQVMRRNWPIPGVIVTLILAVIGGGQISVNAMPTDGLFQGLRDQLLPTFAHFLIALPLVFVAALLLWRRAVLPTVKAKLMFAMHAMFALIAASLFLSAYKWTTLISLLEWSSYFAAFWVVIFCVGRKSGPVWVLASIAFAGAILSCIGILEYGAMRATAPDWRVFATWVNPNALAGMLTLCLFPALALTGSMRRAEAVLSGVGATLILFCILLTGSKGGLLAVAVGLVTFSVCVIWWAGWKRLVRSFVPLAAAALLVFALRASTPASQGSVVSRVQQASSSEVQSSDFRKLLWRSALELSKENEVGTGLNTFRFLGAKPGLTPPTHLAHSTYLQLMAECGPLAVFAFLAALWICAIDALRGSKSMPTEQNILRAGVVAAVAGSLVHNQIDSLLYHFGIGICFFALLGLVLLLSADGSVPEVMRSPGRKLASLAAVALILIWGYASLGELTKSNALGIAQAGLSVSEARAAITSAREFCPFDGETWYVEASTLYPENSPDRAATLQQAIDRSPTVKYYRLLGRSYAALNEPKKAQSAYESALKLDPTNLSAWIQLVQLHAKFGASDEALGTARRMLDFESKPPYQVRAIPEMVPTETAEARVFLADNMADSTQRRDLYRQAVTIYLNYLEQTWPRVKQMGDETIGFAGETPTIAHARLEQGASAAEKLLGLAQRLGDKEGETFAATSRDRLLAGAAGKD